MSRRKLIRNNKFVYHITTRSNSKEWFYLPSKEVWAIATELLAEAQLKFDIEIHNFVLMNNHYHLLVRTPNSDIDKVMGMFNKKMSDKINYSSGRININFGGRYRWNIIQKKSYYLNAYRYIYQNPIRANISKTAEGYPYSTLQLELGKINLPFKVKNYMSNIDLVWINNRFSLESESRIKKGFRKAIFKPSYDSKRRNSQL